MKATIPSNKPSRIAVWWHGIAALPGDRQDHSYYVLRRVWGDHTMAGARGFYNTASEDHLTLALFQIWTVIPDTRWVAELITAAGGNAGTVTAVRWAYACEEKLDARLRPFHKRAFVIPDIMLTWTDEHGEGLLVFEVKRPHTIVKTEDDRKLRTYIDLPSTRGIGRRYGCLLVGEKSAEQSVRACSGSWPVLTWESLGKLQMQSVDRLQASIAAKQLTAAWIVRHYERYGIELGDMARRPEPMGDAYGTGRSYSVIDCIAASDNVKRFLKGSECVEAVWQGEQPTAPMAWLSEEPSAERLAKQKLQATSDRTVCRWRFDWSVRKERIWVLERS
jgi:hypothetical protein